MNKVKTIIKPVAEEVGKFAETAGSQVTGASSQPKADRPLGEEEETKEVVKHLYGADKKTVPRSGIPPSGTITETQKQEEAQKQKLRQELHQQYVQNTFNRPKPPEEKPAERVERQKMEDLREKDEKEKKKKPIIVQRAQQSVEKYRGSAG